MSPVGTALSGGEVLLGPVGVEYVRRALAVALDMHQVHQRPVPPGLAATAALFRTEGIGSPSHAQIGSPGLPMPQEVSSCEPSDLVDTKEAAQMLGCGVRNVVDLVDRGVLTSARSGDGRRHRIPRSEVSLLKRRREDTRDAS